MAAPPGRSLSDLPDELLQHILGFAPSKEAASTAVLSRRWRGLWPTPARAVSLDTRSYSASSNTSGGLRAAFFHGADAAIAAAHGGSVARLAVHVDGGDTASTIQNFMSGYNSWMGCSSCVNDVLAHPATRAVEELAIGATSNSNLRSAAAADLGCELTLPDQGDGGLYYLCMGSIPSKSLRTLLIASCSDLQRPPQPATVFPCLELLQLQECTVSLDMLQDMIAASPHLATLQLERVFLTTLFRRLRLARYYYEWESNDDEAFDDDGRVESLCCPDVTALVLLNCGHPKGVTIELDVPRVRRFRYRGCIHDFRLKSPPPDMRRADLHFIDDSNVHYYRQDFGPTCDIFWHFVKNFRNAKVLKLKLDFPIDDIAVADKKRYDEILGENLFCNLFDLVEMDGQHRRNGKDAGVAIGNLLQCCPAVRELRLNLIAVDTPHNRWRYSTHQTHSERSRKYLDRKAQLDFRKSVGHFMRRKDPLVVSTGGDDKFEVSDIPGLSDKWFNFNCLQFYLRRVSLQFHMDKFNCFGIQLLKFFFERARVLEEMHVDDGNKKLWNHMNRKIGGCSPRSSQPCSEFLWGVSKALGVKQINSSKISGTCSYPNLEVRRTNPWSKGSFTIVPLDR
ncbi:unnamed protein product [Urochloa decumbens]|uniref:F-box domain-containing protein n=1 Tax=Urochloa decumbens TaxID=240449 RepID=A0ABC9AMU9_9POAL